MQIISKLFFIIYSDLKFREYAQPMVKIAYNVCGHVFVADIQSSSLSRYKKVRLKAPSFTTHYPAIKYARCWWQLILFLFFSTNFL